MDQGADCPAFSIDYNGQRCFVLDRNTQVSLVRGRSGRGRNAPGPFKGSVSGDFLLLVFFMNQFPPAQEYPIRTVSNFFENSRRYSQVKVHHPYQRHWRQIVNDTGGKLPPVSTTPATNLPPVVHLELRISPRIFEKIRNGPNSILRGYMRDS